MMQALENGILDACKAASSALSDADIQAALKIDVKPTLRLNAYNKLLSKGRLSLGQRPDPNDPTRRIVVYTWVSAKEAKKFHGLDSSDRLVYETVKKSGQDGVTRREIKFRSNIQNASEVKQIVERLMNRGLIKEIKSVQGANKRVYILSELDPSQAHTGGPWYNDEKEFDSQFIEAIYAHSLAFMKRQQYVTVDQVANYVAESKLSNEELSQNDIHQLMSTMLYDGVIEFCKGPSDDSNSSKYYRHRVPTPAINHLGSIPCGSCPLISDCSPDGVISPRTCVYMTSWLKLASDW